MRDCDCGTCCDPCGHTADCVRHELEAGRRDVAAEVAAEDGFARPRPVPVLSRVDALAQAVTEQGGEWCTRRVRRLYTLLGFDARRATARGDLHRLTCRGLLELHDSPARRYFTVNTATGGTR